MINMLRESMQIDTIAKLLSFVNGDLKDSSDYLVDDAELYNYYVNLTAMMGNHLPDEDEVKTHIHYITENFHEPIPGGRRRLSLVLEVMIYTHYSAVLRKRANFLVQNFD